MEIAKVENYAIQTVDHKEITALLRDAAGPQGITPEDLDRVSIPTGGAQVWTVPTLEGEESRKEVVGIVVHHQDVRAYWSKTLEESGGSEAPDCSSPDAITGFGEPGGACAKCPLAQWGTDKRGRGQACKACKVLFLLLPDSMLPITVTLAPTSIAPARKYLLRLASRALKPQAVITRLVLEKAKNQDGIAYSVAALSMVGSAPKELAATAWKYAQEFKDILGKVSVQADEVK